MPGLHGLLLVILLLQLPLLPPVQRRSLAAGASLPPVAAQAISVSGAAAENAAPADGVPVRTDLLVYTTLTVTNPSNEPARGFRADPVPLVLPQTASQQVVALWDQPAILLAADGTQRAAASSAGAGIDIGAGEQLRQRRIALIAWRQDGDALHEDAANPAYLQPEEGIESDHPLITAQARAWAGTETAVTARARNLVYAVSRYLKYDPASPAANRGALAGLQARSGACTEYAALFVAAARAVGIPARYISGYATSDDAAPFRERHAWAEFYDPATGWIPVDPTWAAAYSQEEVLAFLPRRRLGIAFGFGGQSGLSATHYGRAPLEIGYRTEVVPLADPKTSTRALP